MKRIFLFMAMLFSCIILAQEKDSIPMSFDIEEVAIERQVKKAKVGDKIRLENLNFIGGTAKLVPESEPVLEGLLKVMRNFPDLKIDIQGHICCDKYKDHELSRQRAKMVYEYLRKGGIDKSRISYHNFGGSRPIYIIPEASEAQREINRRVEIEIIEN